MKRDYCHGTEPKQYTAVNGNIHYSNSTVKIEANLPKALSLISEKLTVRQVDRIVSDRLRVFYPTLVLMNSGGR